MIKKYINKRSNFVTKWLDSKLDALAIWLLSRK